MDNFGPFTIDEVEEAFHTFDLDGNNYVGANEIRQIFDSIKEEVTDEEIDEMINMIDTDGDGQICLSEFTKMVFQYASQCSAPPSEEYLSDRGESEYSNHILSLNKNESGSLDQITSINDLSKAENKSKLESKTQNKRPLRTKTESLNLSDTRSGTENRENLQQAMTALGLSHFSIDEFIKKFEEVDSDHSGLIEYEEFIKLLNLPNNIMSKQMFHTFDQDKTGSINAKEFLVGISHFLVASNDERIKFAFEMFDDDNSGSISMSELIRILKANHLVSSDAQVVKKAKIIMRHGDKDGDGTINYNEFVDVCHKFPNLLFPMNVASSNLSHLFSK